MIIVLGLLYLNLAKTQRGNEKRAREKLENSFAKERTYLIKRIKESEALIRDNHQLLSEASGGSGGSGEEGAGGALAGVYVTVSAAVATASLSTGVVKLGAGSTRLVTKSDCRSSKAFVSLYSRRMSRSVSTEMRHLPSALTTTASGLAGLRP